jgi:UDP-N-acetylmuramoyl-tripeptide--D-alanyl-D-alanine ligase
MMRMRLGDVATLTGGRLIGADGEIAGMIHDSRSVRPGNLFVALPGSHSDGHDFVAQAASAGAGAALVTRELDVDLSQILVPDVLTAMGQVAAGWRRQLDLTVIGVTGSNGKTTVKEMITAILSEQAPTLATKGNYNNEIGLPLTLSRLDARHRYAVLEMGASRPGDIRYLASLARPDIGVVTNAASAHLEGFGSLEGVARTKGELFQSLPEEGMAVINTDDAYYSLWRELSEHCQHLGFGFSDQADVRGQDLDGGARITTPAGSVDLRLKLPGRHNLMNAMAAMAVATHLGIPPAQSAAALGKLQSLPGRFQVHRSGAGWCLIDDTYNANPASLYAGLVVLANMPGEDWLVLGDMAELGPDSEKLHAEMGRSAVDLGVRRLFCIGQASQAAAAAFGPGAMHFESHKALCEALSEALKPGVNCLVKGSRSMAMERVVDVLIGEKH